MIDGSNYSDAHGIANLIDPKFSGINMPDLEDERLINFSTYCSRI
jgi:hypothetical protein